MYAWTSQMLNRDTGSTGLKIYGPKRKPEKITT